MHWLLRHSENWKSSISFLKDNDKKYITIYIYKNGAREKKLKLHLKIQTIVDRLKLQMLLEPALDNITKLQDKNIFGKVVWSTRNELIGQFHTVKLFDRKLLQVLYHGKTWRSHWRLRRVRNVEDMIITNSLMQFSRFYFWNL